MKREMTDFYMVDDAHIAIHERLNNWATWCRGSTRAGVHPMFRMYRPDNWERDMQTAKAMDPLDAARVQKGVAALPEKHRHSVQWFYVLSGPPKVAARQLAVSVQGLSDLVRNSRQMLINRSV